MSAEEVPTCIHDGEFYAKEESNPKRLERITRAWCSSCHAMLWEQRLDLVTFKIERYNFDNTYWLLYTRAGRLELVREALNARGWPIPAVWKDLR